MNQNAMQRTAWGVKEITDAGGVDIQLEPCHRVVLINVPTGAHDIYLPSVFEAFGLTYTVYTVANAGTYNIVIKANTDDKETATFIRNTVIGPAVGITLNAIDDYVVLYCDGIRWNVLEEDV